MGLTTKMQSVAQSCLDRFVERVNGKGRSIAGSPPICTYVPENEHPGCAIGCLLDDQSLMNYIKDEGLNREGVIDLLEHLEANNMENVFWRCIGFQDTPDMDSCDEFITFMVELQDLHDSPQNWDGKFLWAECVREFANVWGLNSPL